MAWGRRRAGHDVPEAVLAVGVPAGDKLITAARDQLTGRWVLVNQTSVAVVTAPDDGSTEGSSDSEWPSHDHGAPDLVLSRPWLEVEAGAWDPESDTLRVAWVGEGSATSWRFTGPGARILTDAFRDRVQASVVLVREVDLGPGRKTRVAIRKDLATRELLEQVVPGRGVSPDDTELAEQVAVARATLRDQSGLPPVTA